MADPVSAIRDQAIRAAIGTSTHTPGIKMAAAEAASDVWEPLLRDLFDAYCFKAADIALPARLKGIGTRVLLALEKP